MADNDGARSSFLAKFGAATGGVALLFSLFSFWYTYWQPASVKIRAGNALYISYGYEGNMGVVIPLVYSNTGAIAGIIDKVELRCGKKGQQESDALYPVYYAKIMGAFNEMDAFVVPETIKGGDQFTRLILFWSDVDWIKKHDFSVGEYECSVLASYDGSNSTEVSHFSFPIRQGDLDHLKEKAPGNRTQNQPRMRNECAGFAIAHRGDDDGVTPWSKTKMMMPNSSLR